MKKRIAIFASGNGSNAENIVQYFNNHKTIEIALIVTNNPKAYVLERAKKLGIKSLSLSHSTFSKNGDLYQKMIENDINWIVLAGFLLKVPKNITKSFANKIINIHPSLLPKYGGKGMYGDRVHQAVIAAKEKESGITIHYVNDHYDEGKIIFQAKCSIDANDTPEDLAKKIHELEYQYFPRVIEESIS